MLKDITLRLTEDRIINIELNGATVIVGPNNSGKSLLLREIEMCFRNYEASQKNKFVSAFDIAWAADPEAEIQRLIADGKIRYRDLENGRVIAVSNRPWSDDESRLDPNGVDSILRHRSLHAVPNIYRAAVLRLDGTQRAQLLSKRRLHPLTG